eukprot:SAG11_NODE_26030_length_350_cov_2.434263_1_plen_50_part_10
MVRDSLATTVDGAQSPHDIDTDCRGSQCEEALCGGNDIRSKSERARHRAT